MLGKSLLFRTLNSYWYGGVPSSVRALLTAFHCPHQTSLGVTGQIDSFVSISPRMEGAAEVRAPWRPGALEEGGGIS